MSKIVKGKLNTYGEIIGIMMTNKRKPRILGDIGNANTFNFPVRYKVIKEANSLSHLRGDPKLLNPFIKAAKELEEEGIKAITTSCGFLIFYQKALSDTISIPVFTSSLLLISLLTKTIGKEDRIGVITANSDLLNKESLNSIGIKSEKLVIKGMQNSVEFKKTILDDNLFLDYEKLKDEVVSVVIKMISKNCKIKVILLECTNLAPFSKLIQELTKLPVFDIVTLVNFVYSSFI